MTTAISPETRALPLVAVVSRIPILAEALAATLESFAKVEYFPAEQADLPGMLRHLRPNAVVVDNDADLADVETIARAQQFALVVVGLADRTLRVLDESGWTQPVDGDASAEAIRNVVLGRLFARGAVQ